MDSVLAWLQQLGHERYGRPLSDVRYVAALLSIPSEERIGIDYAHRHGHPLTVATTKVHIACFDALREHAVAAREHAAAALAFCKENSFLVRQAEAQIAEEWAPAENGDATAGVAETEAALAVWQQLGAHIYGTHSGICCSPRLACAPEA